MMEYEKYKGSVGGGLGVVKKCWRRCGEVLGKVWGMCHVCVGERCWVSVGGLVRGVG